MSTPAHTRLLRARRIDPETNCWRRDLAGRNRHRWTNTGSRSEGKRGIHVIAYEAWVGPIPPGMQVDHVYARGCRYRDCFNPAHLEAVTPRENFMRGDGPRLASERGQARTHCKRGHEFTPENILPTQRGKYLIRRCRACYRENWHRWNAKRKAA